MEDRFEDLEFDDEISQYLAGNLKAGPGWHFCYQSEEDKKGSWKKDMECKHGAI